MNFHRGCAAGLAFEHEDLNAAKF
jgi:hypothetical protein